MVSVISIRVGRIIGFLMVSLCCLILAGCGDKPQEPQKPVAVKQKIVVPKASPPPAPADVAPEAEITRPATIPATTPATTPDTPGATVVTRKITPPESASEKPMAVGIKPESVAPIEVKAEPPSVVVASRDRPAPEGVSPEAATPDDRPKVAGAGDAGPAEAVRDNTAAQARVGLPEMMPESTGAEASERRADAASASGAAGGKATVKAGESAAPEGAETGASAADMAVSAAGSTLRDVGQSALASIFGLTRKAEVEKKRGYDPAGRVDPFERLFKEEPEQPEEEPQQDLKAGEEPKKKKRIPRTPLEKMDLGQLKLVGIIRAQSGNRALVEESSGKGYIISEGTYIGIHSGRVKEILKDRVIVEEEYQDVYGKAVVRTRELKIDKPPGEGYHEM